MKIGDCDRCGGGVGRKDQTLCHRCRAADAEARRRAHCPSCDEFLRLDPETGRCIRCSRTCVDCGHVLRFKASVRCLACRRRHDAASQKRSCLKCGRLGYLRSGTGWCGSCSRRPCPPLAAKPCTVCGELRRKQGEGMCNRCWQRHPDRPLIRVENLIVTLEEPPEWLRRFADRAAERHCVARACLLITGVGRLLEDGDSRHPQQILERARRPGRSAGTLARTLEEFFVEEGLAFGLDQSARLANGRRQRRVQASPDPLRPAVASFAEHLVRSRERAQRAGTRPRSDSTFDSTLAVVRDLARFLVAQRHKTDWATVDTDDLEVFLCRLPASRTRNLGVLRQFFRFAKKTKLILVDPTRPIRSTGHHGFSGRTLTVTEQRRLFRRWASGNEAHPHEALVGVLALLHAASGTELRGLRLDDIDQRARTIQLGQRPAATPLDPVTAAVLERALSHHHGLQTRNRHVLVTRATKTRNVSCSPAYLSHSLDPAGVSPQRLRVTRLADLVVSLDPKVVAAAFGMNADGLVDYLADTTNDTGIAEQLEL